MINSNKQKPVVLVIAGHDPSGGAGIQADIESIANAGCHPVTIITSLTSQNTCKVTDVLPQKPEHVQAQIQLLREDMDIVTCKIGLIGNLELLDVIIQELSVMNIPTVLDPVLGSTTGTIFTDTDICKKMLASLLPLTTLITPNSVEAKTLAGSDDLAIAAAKLLDHGTNSVLITGTHEASDDVINTLYTKVESPIEYHWERLTGTFHGSGCTLSARIAALLALEYDLTTAVEKAQEYTWQSLKHGMKLGRGQAQPDRFYH